MSRSTSRPDVRRAPNRHPPRQTRRRNRCRLFQERPASARNGKPLQAIAIAPRFESLDVTIQSGKRECRADRYWRSPGLIIVTIARVMLGITRPAARYSAVGQMWLSPGACGHRSLQPANRLRARASPAGAENRCTGGLPETPPRAASCSASALAAATTSVWIRSGRRTAGRRGCRGRRSG